MKRIPHALPPAIRASGICRAASEVCATLRASGHEAYFVGGAVRDLLLRPEDVPTDIDIATDAFPEEVTASFPGSGYVGKSFGVSLVRHAGLSFEVATFRCEGTYSDRRHPDSVRLGTLEEDSRRRDFTINALYMDPLAEEILDFHGGLDHLREGVIACVGDARARLFEDPLRILRLFRFAVATGFAVETATLHVVRTDAEVRGGIPLLSKERILAEMAKVRSGCGPAFFRMLLSVVPPALFDPELPAWFPVEERLADLAGHPAWRRVPSLHARFPATAFALFLAVWAGIADEAARRGGEPREEEALFKALSHWPLHTSDRELARVVLHLHAGVPIRGLGVPSANLDVVARGVVMMRILKQVKEATLEEFLGLVELLGAKIPMPWGECFERLGGRFAVEALEFRWPLPDLLKRASGFAPPALPGRGELSELHKSAALPPQALGSLHLLHDACSLLGVGRDEEADSAEVRELLKTHGAWKPRWLGRLAEPDAELFRLRFQGVVLAFEDGN